MNAHCNIIERLTEKIPLDRKAQLATLFTGIYIAYLLLLSFCPSPSQKFFERKNNNGGVRFPGTAGLLQVSEKAKSEI